MYIYSQLITLMDKSTLVEIAENAIDDQAIICKSPKVPLDDKANIYFKMERKIETCLGELEERQRIARGVNTDQRQSFLFDFDEGKE